MQIFAFKSAQDNTPGGQWVARIWLGSVRDPKTGATQSTFHPVIFQGVGEGQVRLAAQCWWDDQLAKEAAKIAKGAAKKKPSESAPIPLEDIGDVL